MNSLYSEIDLDDLIVMKICLKLNLLSERQLEEVFSKNLGRQFIFALAESHLLTEEQMANIFAMRRQSVLCEYCKSLNTNDNNREVIICQHCQRSIRVRNKRGATTARRRKKRFGKFRVGEKIGEGNVGIVYQALDTTLNRTVALKVLKNSQLNDTALQRFQQEAQAIAALNHPAIVLVYDIGQDQGHHFIAMEYIKGKKLNHFFREKHWTINEFVAIVIQIAKALQHAHDKSIIHRDIKPENILITPELEVKVTDFGLARRLSQSQDARLTQNQMIMGTPMYMSPEQARGEGNLNHQSDIYSLGVVIYEVLAGRTPFEEAPTEALLSRIVFDDPPHLQEIKPDLPAELSRICMKCLEKKREHRYLSMNELLEDLSKFNQEGSVFASQPEKKQVASEYSLDKTPKRMEVNSLSASQQSTHSDSSLNHSHSTHIPWSRTSTSDFAQPKNSPQVEKPSKQQESPPAPEPVETKTSPTPTTGASSPTRTTAHQTSAFRQALAKEAQQRNRSIEVLQMLIDLSLWIALLILIIWLIVRLFF